jgi:hypothetical protein
MKSIFGGMPLALAIVLTILNAGAMNASTKVTVTAPDGFAEGIGRVALVAAECAPQLDCPDVLKRVAATIKAELKLALKLAGDDAVRDALFKMGIRQRPPLADRPGAAAQPAPPRPASPTRSSAAECQTKPSRRPVAT